MPKLARRITETSGKSFGMFGRAAALEAAGADLIHLEVGKPIHDTPQHIGKVELAGGKVVTVPLDAADDFSIRADWIEAAITPRTKMIVLINPCNPTGRVFTRAELEGLARVAIDHDLFVLSDEVYEYITFGEKPHVSIASLPGMRERTVSTYAFTKAYAMDGWRLGYLCADASLIPALMKITANEVTHVNLSLIHI